MKCESRSVMSDSATPWTIQSMEFSSQNTGVGSLSLLQGIFLTQGLDPGLPHRRGILYQLSHKGSPLVPRREFLKKASSCLGLYLF